MNVYEVYMEGYVDNGGRCGASYVSYGRGDNFAEAAKNACIKKFGEKETEKFFEVHGGRPFFWGCEMFDNYADAAKSFG